MARIEPVTSLDLLPELNGKEALLLARLLTRIADDIWRTYSVDIYLELAQELGPEHDLQTATDYPRPDDDDDLPF